jgi:hypothetical protein
MKPESWEERNGGPEKEKKSFIKSVCRIKSGGQQHFFLHIKDVNIILNLGQKRKSGIILKIVF